MIDPVDTEREPTHDAPEARVFPNPVVPIGSSTTVLGAGIPPAVAISGDPEDAANRVSDETDEPWSYRTQAEVGADHDFSSGTTPLADASGLAEQESDAARLNTEYVP
ncbi:hypothetical protein EON77_01390 [bacterium]|nr:MAG: hypothetical protein EON77_01390 [bacterium]